MQSILKITILISLLFEIINNIISKEFTVYNLKIYLLYIIIFIQIFGGN